MYKRWNTCFQNIPPYPRLLLFKRSYQQVTQWTGREFRSMVSCVMAVAAPLLCEDNGSPYSPEDKEVLDCLRGMVEFSHICHQRKHTPTSLDEMEKKLQQFQDSKVVFHKYRKGKRAQKKFESELTETRRTHRYSW